MISKSNANIQDDENTALLKSIPFSDATAPREPLPPMFGATYLLMFCGVIACQQAFFRVVQCIWIILLSLSGTAYLVWLLYTLIKAGEFVALPEVIAACLADLFSMFGVVLYICVYKGYCEILIRQSFKLLGARTTTATVAMCTFCASLVYMLPVNALDVWGAIQCDQTALFTMSTVVALDFACSIGFGVVPVLLFALQRAHNLHIRKKLRELRGRKETKEESFEDESEDEELYRILEIYELVVGNEERNRALSTTLAPILAIMVFCFVPTFLFVWLRTLVAIKASEMAHMGWWTQIGTVLADLVWIFLSLAIIFIGLTLVNSSADAVKKEGILHYAFVMSTESKRVRRKVSKKVLEEEDIDVQSRREKVIESSFRLMTFLISTEALEWRVGGVRVDGAKVSTMIGLLFTVAGVAVTYENAGL